jgi:hypothetical protein
LCGCSRVTATVISHSILTQPHSIPFLSLVETLSQPSRRRCRIPAVVVVAVVASIVITLAAVVAVVARHCRVPPAAHHPPFAVICRHQVIILP